VPIYKCVNIDSLQKQISLLKLKSVAWFRAYWEFILWVKKASFSA